MSVLVALVVCGTVLWLARQGERLLRDYWAWLDRRLEKVTAPAEEMVPIPPDLAQIAAQESQPWAQEDVADALRKTYRDLGDWNLVREHFKDRL